jgi:hypothetical protein
MGVICMSVYASVRLCVSVSFSIQGATEYKKLIFESGVGVVF